MTILDCHSTETILSTAAAIIRIEPERLMAKLRTFSTEEWQSVKDRLWRKLRFRKERRFDGVFWFHFTRTPHPESFRKHGILPFGLAVEHIWSIVFELIGNEQSDKEKQAFRERVEAGEDHHFAWDYKNTAKNLYLCGPFGMLFREMAFEPSKYGHYDYFQKPESLLLIHRCYSAWYGSDVLLSRFIESSKPCIVKFREDTGRQEVLRSALLYLWAKQCADQSMSQHGAETARMCFDGQGCAVPPENVVDVEIVEVESAQSTRWATGGHFKPSKEKRP